MESRVNRFTKRYVRQFAEASGGKTPDAKAIALKGLEEYIELLFAAGVEPHQISAVYWSALRKEIDRDTKPSREGVVAEIAEVEIMLNIFSGLSGIPDQEVCNAVDDKHAINDGRRWRVNEFGSLSHIKDKP